MFLLVPKSNFLVFPHSLAKAWKREKILVPKLRCDNAFAQQTSFNQNNIGNATAA